MNTGVDGFKIHGKNPSGSEGGGAVNISKYHATEVNPT